jgi:hypothetical protein
MNLGEFPARSPSGPARVKARPLAGLALVVALVLAASGGAQADPTPPNFTLAFLGDQGLGPDPMAVLPLIVGRCRKCL